MPQTEVWKDIPNFPGYQASTEGRIRSVDRFVRKKGASVPVHIKGRILSPEDDGRGYKHVSLRIDPDIKAKSYYVHRLVLETFSAEHDEHKTDVNHIDGDKGNNRLDNLEWCTRSENNYHAYNTGLHICGEDHPQAKYSTELISTIRRRHANGERVCDLSREYGIPHQYISGVLNERKRVRG